MTPRSMIVNLRGDHQFVRTGRSDEWLQPTRHGIRTANDRIGHGMFHARPLGLRPKTIEIVPRGLQWRGQTTSEIDELNLKGSEQAARLIITVSGNDGDSSHGIGRTQVDRWAEPLAIQPESR